MEPDDNDGRSEHLDVHEAHFLGRDSMKDAMDKLDRFDQLSMSEAKDMAMMINDDKMRQYLLHGIDAAEASGIRSPSRIQGLESYLRFLIPKTFHTIEHEGGLTAVSSVVFNRNRGRQTWKVLEMGPGIIAANFHEGDVGWIAGGLGTGKTSTGLTIAEYWMEAGNTAFSNIQAKGGGDLYVHTPDMKALLLGIADTLESDPLALSMFIWDGLAFSGYYKEDATTKKDKLMNRFVRIIRKFNLNLLVIEQRAASVPTYVQEESTSRYYCHRKGGGVVSVDLTGRIEWSDKIEDFPPTSLDFKSKQNEGFLTTESVDLEALYVAITGTTDYPTVIRRFFKD